MSQITTHILDTACGHPAEAVDVTLYQYVDNDWQAVGAGRTNSDGRASHLLPDNHVLSLGVYKLVFLVEAYFQQKQTDSFYPYVEINFRVDNDQQHYHVPLLLNPFGYSTYRGS